MFEVDAVLGGTCTDIPNMLTVPRMPPSLSASKYHRRSVRISRSLPDSLRPCIQASQPATAAHIPTLPENGLVSSSDISQVLENRLVGVGINNLITYNNTTYEHKVKATMASLAKN